MKKISIALIVVLLAGVGLFIHFYSEACGMGFSEPQPNISSGEEISIFVVSDPHYFSPRLHDDGEAFSRFLHCSDKLVHYSEEAMETLVWEIKEKKPDILLLTGDLTCNGEAESHRQMAEKFLAIEQAGTSVYVIPGNHDVLNPCARQYFEGTICETDTVTKEGFLDIYGEFGYLEAISRDTRSLSYLVAPSEDIWILMLDSAIYSYNMEKNTSVREGMLRESTLKWMEKCGKEAAAHNARLIAVMHHSLLHHSLLINDGYTILNSEDALKVFCRSGIELVLTGHIHLQDIEKGVWEGKPIYDIATSSLIVYPNQYGAIKYSPEGGLLYQTCPLDVRAFALAHHLEEPELLDFEETSRQFFVAQCCSEQNGELDKMEGLTEDERTKVRETISQMNLKYFSGFRNQRLEMYTQTEGFHILENLPPNFLQDYVKNMLNDDLPDHNVLNMWEK